MARVVIDGHRFDTRKAQIKWELEYWDGHNWHTGMLCMSSTGIWYTLTPSQWSNMHNWEIIDPTEAMERYAKYLTSKQKAIIADLAGLDWE
jgi:hypothetical protein